MRWQELPLPGKARCVFDPCWEEKQDALETAHTPMFIPAVMLHLDKFRMQQFIIWAMFVSGGVLQGWVQCPREYDNVFVLLFSRDEDNWRWLQNPLCLERPRNASVALEAGGWTETPICVTLNDHFLLCLWAFIKKYKRKMTVSFALAKKPLWTSADTQGKLWTGPGLDCYFFGLCTATRHTLPFLSHQRPFWWAYMAAAAIMNEMWNSLVSPPKSIKNQACSLRKIEENTCFNFASNHKTYILKYAYISRNSG